MTLEIITPRSLRLGEIFAVLLGLGLSTITISARIYVKSRVFRRFLSEDCMPLRAVHPEKLCLHEADFSIAAYVRYGMERASMNEMRDDHGQRTDNMLGRPVF